MKKIGLMFTILFGSTLFLSSCGNSNKFTVTWENYDGTVLEVDEEVKKDETPSYDGITPYRENTDKYTYTFKGWSPSVSIVTGDITYRAQFTETINKYTITWKNYDGITLKVDNIEYGTMPRYSGSLPSRNGNDQYTYTFKEWSPTITSVTCDQIYTANFEQSTNEYTVTWKNYDGSILKTSTLSYGETPYYDGTPLKEEDDIHYYEFIGWYPEVQQVTSNIEYVAQYEQHDSEFYIIKYNAFDGIFDESPQYKVKGETIKLSSNKPTYEGHAFLGWNNIYEDKIYQPGDDFELDKNTTLCAMWAEECDSCDHKGTITTQQPCFWCSGQGSLCKCGEVGIAVPYGYCIKCYSYSRTSCLRCGGSGKYVSTSICSDCSGNLYKNEYFKGSFSTEERSIIIEVKEGYEYSLDGITFQTNPIFDGLKPNTTYHLYSRLATSGKIPFGRTSKPIEVKTNEGTLFFIEYDLKGGINNPSNPTSFEPLRSFNLFEPTKDHYRFTYWSRNGVEFDPKHNFPLSDIVLEANYEPIVYSIEYVLDGGTNSSYNPTNHNIESDDIILREPTKPGYKFIGWTGSNGITPSLEVIIEKGNSQKLTYIANYEILVGTITYNLNGSKDTHNNPTTFTINTNPINLNPPVFDGYEGYWINKNGSRVDIINTRSEGTFGANFELTAYKNSLPIRYKIQYGYIYDGTINDNPTSYNIESDDIILNKPVRQGYEFIGWTWYSSKGEVGPQMDVTIPKGSFGDKHFFANWKPSTYSITYVLDGGENSPENPTTYTYEDEYFRFYSPTKEGYKFIGWYFGPEAGLSYEWKIWDLGDFSSFHLQDVTIYARYEEITD